MILLGDILNREFKNINKYLGTSNTAQAQAKYLNISAGQLSRLKNGKYKLSRENAFDWASKLRVGAGHSVIEALALELLHGSELIHSNENPTHITKENDVSTEQAAELFRRLSHSDCLLCVKYGDMPRALESSKYSAFSEMVGEAVNNGLCFALFQPFPQLTEKISDTSNSLPTTIKNYLTLHRDSVRDVYREMRQAVDPTARKRIRLFERIPSSDSQVDISPLVQSRLFYCEFLPPTESIGKGKEQEIWEWVSTSGDDDLFVQRESDSIQVQLSHDLHQPVTWFYNKHRRLPNDKTELEEAHEEWCKIASLGEVKLTWEIYE